MPQTSVVAHPQLANVGPHRQLDNQEHWSLVFEVTTGLGEPERLIYTVESITDAINSDYSELSENLGGSWLQVTGTMSIPVLMLYSAIGASVLAAILVLFAGLFTVTADALMLVLLTLLGASAVVFMWFAAFPPDRAGLRLRSLWLAFGFPALGLFLALLI